MRAITIRTLAGKKTFVIQLRQDSGSRWSTWVSWTGLEGWNKINSALHLNEVLDMANESRNSSDLEVKFELI